MSIDPYLAWEMAETAIHLAPKLAGGAQKLWNGMRGKTPLPEQKPSKVAPEAHKSVSDEATPLRNDWAEVAIEDLHNRMLASTDLIRVLADQQAQLAKSLEAARHQVEEVESQNQQLVARLELDQQSIKALEDAIGPLVKQLESNFVLQRNLEAKNAHLASEIVIERLRVNRLTSVCIGNGLIAVIGFAMVVRLALQ